MRLGEMQEDFSLMVTLLLIEAHDQGYQVRIGHTERCQDCKVGIKHSKHKKRLAIDLHLFKDGKYLKETEDHETLGIYWEGLGGTWGGRFMDGNHYEY